MDGNKYKNSGTGYLFLICLIFSVVGGYIGYQFYKLGSFMSGSTDEKITMIATFAGGGVVLGAIIGYPFAKILEGIGEIIDNQQYQIDSLSRRIDRLSNEIYSNMQTKNTHTTNKRADKNGTVKCWKCETDNKVDLKSYKENGYWICESCGCQNTGGIDE
ncbi:MAG: hypothetical protein IJ060_12890 [Oscillospiraceae bacterium]|nr:hypothetical protein [Oscillospiraceae bacterium]